MTVRSLSAAGIIPKPRCRRKRGIISGALPRACRGGQDILLTRCNCFRFYISLSIDYPSDRGKEKKKLSRPSPLKNNQIIKYAAMDEGGGYKIQEDNIYDSS